MNHPYRENLEVCADADGKWIRCTRCLHRLCPEGNDWKNACTRTTFPPTKAGPLMSDLIGRYLLVKLYCPSCGTLLDADMVEKFQGDQ